MNLNEIRFEEPVRQNLALLNRHYYTQALKYRGEDLYFATNWFNASNGVKNTDDNKKELLTVIPCDAKKCIKQIEEIAIRNGLKLPVEFQSQDSNAEIFKSLPDREFHYLKLNYDCDFFDKAGRVIKVETLNTGDYRAIIHVKGLYIGHHPTGKLVSLQLRISQIQFAQRIPTCMFMSIPAPKVPSPMPLPISGMHNGVPETPQPINETVMMNQPVRRGRKPTKLVRQNNMQDCNPARMDALPPDFFQEALMDLSSLQSTSTSNV